MVGNRRGQNWEMVAERGRDVGHLAGVSDVFCLDAARPEFLGFSQALFSSAAA